MAIHEIGFCRKTSKLPVSRVRIAEEGEHIVTLNSEGNLEREGDCVTKAGDRVVTDGRGQPYIIRKEKFESLYEVDPEDPNNFISRNHGFAIQANDAMPVYRADGTTLQAGAGDIIFFSAVTGTTNIISIAEFVRTYVVTRPPIE
jgi:hypothetical protein